MNTYRRLAPSPLNREPAPVPDPLGWVFHVLIRACWIAVNLAACVLWVAFVLIPTIKAAENDPNLSGLVYIAMHIEVILLAAFIVTRIENLRSRPRRK